MPDTPTPERVAEIARGLKTAERWVMEKSIETHARPAPEAGPR